MGAAVAHGHAEALGAADGDVGAPVARGRQQGEGQEVGGDDDEGAGGVGLFDEVAVVTDGSLGVGVLQEYAEGIGIGAVGLVVADDDPVAEGFGAYFDGVDGLGMALFRDKEGLGSGAAFLGAFAHHHGLGGGGGFVEEGGR